MSTPHIDHIVVAADNLDQGCEYVSEMLGVAPSGGGEHTAMGTHNRVLKLGDRCYLEVIAINPHAPKPACPRWFGLDTWEMQRSLRVKPRLVTWAIRTDSIEEMAAKVSAPLGIVTDMTRGALRWRLTLTEDGRLPEEGIIPFLIQWEGDSHPTSSMPESGCTLAGLYGRHSQPEAIKHVLQSLGAERLLKVEALGSAPAPFLTAMINTPNGVKELT